MHEITGRKEEVLRLLKDTIVQLGHDSPKDKQAGIRASGLPNASQWPAQRDQIIEVLKRGYEREQPKGRVRAAGIGAISNKRGVDTSYAPRNRTVAVFQAAMDEFLDAYLNGQETKETGPRALSIGAKSPKPVKSPPSLQVFYADKRAPKRGTAGAADIFAQFGNLDPRWVQVWWEKAQVFLQGKHQFIQHTATTDFRFPLADQATIAIVGDWGGGNAAAQKVAAQIKQKNPDHIIHLGDVYYAGTPKEVEERFLQYWPTPTAPGRSFALNSNHEMYSGGYGYFDVILQRFQQPASYFSLGNQHWRLIGLDTGYVDHDLNREQVEWLTAQFADSQPKTILLTHHQLFSAYEDTDTDILASRVQPFLRANQIYGWFWGHEHLCAVYEGHLGVKARCLGNGCFPYNLPAEAPQVPIEWLNTRRQPDDPDYQGIHTFALLRINGQQVVIEYIDQDGHVGYTETWT
jgi:hypothetical protein